MKARVKATGEIVDVLPCAEEDGAVRFYANMENKWHEAHEIDIVSEVTQPDYWEKLKHQYAGMAMQGILSNNNLLNFLCEGNKKPLSKIVLDNADIIATALVNRLKEEKK